VRVVQLDNAVEAGNTWLVDRVRALESISGTEYVKIVPITTLDGAQRSLRNECEVGSLIKGLC
jgi:hypothetical protein